MSYPVYTMPPSADSKVKIYINGESASKHPSPSKHARYLNFVGELVPDIIENDETFDINLGEFVSKIIDSKKKKSKRVIKPKKDI